MLFSNPDVFELRKVMNSAEHDSDKARYFKNHMESIETDITILQAYQAISRLIYIKHFEPFWIKWFVFKRETKRLDQIIESDPNQLELRFLRYAVQDQAPFFLGYNDNLKEDKLKIEHCFGECSDDLKRLIYRYFIRFEQDLNRSSSSNDQCKCS
jgi:hypothetical protein